MEVLGIRLVGVNPENGQKLLLTLAFVALVYAVRRVVHALVRLAFRGRRKEVLRFWTRQGINLATTLVLILGLLSVWFDDPARLATALGLVTAGLAFALQRVVTAVAGYFVILRGQTFGVGDRIAARRRTRGCDWSGLHPDHHHGDGPARRRSEGRPGGLVRSASTGRVVTVSNAKIFDEPVYNYTREFPYLWEEAQPPHPYSADRGRAERISWRPNARRGTLPTRSATRSTPWHDATSCRRPPLSQRCTTTSPTTGWRLTVRFVVQERGAVT